MIVYNPDEQAIIDHYSNLPIFSLHMQYEACEAFISECPEGDYYLMPEFKKRANAKLQMQAIAQILFERQVLGITP